ncbi:MAG: hypothetical protein B193_3119 [Solidesulfovibrio magneticus str. Maddingley MBC34]|uniref:Secreted protein n=1 Tax=Solidesulfovibrio magneticus str. Maddingley MBC34 TaxID=1206767 RepID=K6GAQ4_9BACT|nr:MAG: hypothetical protein B193_3119 [Solidesulfovibrio magneticus str. Maddingley MBC34]
MKKFLSGLVVAMGVLLAGQAMAAFGDGLGAWWLDGDLPAAAGTGACGTCLGGTGGPGGLGLGLGLGYGDGTMPMPQNGTGFGSPWTK